MTANYAKLANFRRGGRGHKRASGAAAPSPQRSAPTTTRPDSREHVTFWVRCGRVGVSFQNSWPGVRAHARVRVTPPYPRARSPGQRRRASGRNWWPGVAPRLSPWRPGSKQWPRAMDWMDEMDPLARTRIHRTPPRPKCPLRPWRPFRPTAPPTAPSPWPTARRDRRATRATPAPKARRASKERPAKSPARTSAPPSAACQPQAGTSANTNAVSQLGLTVSDPPTQSELQAVANKLDELIAALRR